MEKKKKIKILFLINNLMYGGAEKVLVQLVNHMDRERFDITVQTLFDVGIHRQFLSSGIHYKGGYRIYYRGNTALQKAGSPQFWYSRCIRETYDILVAYLEGTCTRILGGCTDQHCVRIAWRHFAEQKEEFVHAYRSMREAKEIYRGFDQIVCVSKSVAESYEALTGNRERVTVKYNTNDTEKIRRLAKEEVPNRDFQRKDLIRICGVAKIMPRKGFFRLAKVHRRLQEEGYHYRIYLLGEGEEQAAIERYLKKYHLEESFRFLGYDTNPYRYMSRCAFFVCASYEEGFSTAACEALIAGTAVLTTRCAGMEEMLGAHQEYGVIVENSEEGLYLGMKDFLEHPEKRQYYREQAKKRGAMFQTEETVAAVEQMFLELWEKKEACKEREGYGN